MCEVYSGNSNIIFVANGVNDVVLPNFLTYFGLQRQMMQTLIHAGDAGAYSQLGEPGEPGHTLESELCPFCSNDVGNSSGTSYMHIYNNNVNNTLSDDWEVSSKKCCYTCVLSRC